MQEINAWLQSDQDYYSGVKLYSKYGKSDFVKNILSAGPTPFNIQKLEAELTKLAPAPPANAVEIPPTITPIDQAIPLLINDKKKIYDHQRFLTLEQDRNNLYREIERLMAFNSILQDPNELHRTAKSILLKHQKIQSIWHELDLYAESGTFPEKEIKVIKTNRKQLIHQSISKAKKRLQSGKCKNVERTKALINKLKLELSEL